MKAEIRSWLLAIFLSVLVGFVSGIIISTKYFELRVAEAVELKRFLYNKQVYDIMPFDRTSK